MWPLNCMADCELRICVPMSDVSSGRLDNGLRLLLGIGGKGPQMDFTVEIKRMIISAPRHCLYNVRPDRY